MIARAQKFAADGWQTAKSEFAARPTGSRASIRRHLLASVAILLLLGGGVGGWAATIQISGALIAQGSVVVDQNVQKV